MKRLSFVLVLGLLLCRADEGRAAETTFRYASRSMITAFAPVSQPGWGRNLCVSLDCGSLFGKTALRPKELLVVNAWWTPLPYGIYRQKRLLAPDSTILPNDRFLVNYADTAARIPNIHYGVAAYIFTAAPSPLPSEYGKLSAEQVAAAQTPDDLSSEEKGLLDWSAPVSLRQPASLIQMDSLYSARWKLWWQFAGAPPGDRQVPETLRKEFPTWLDIPAFSIVLNSMTDPGRQGFGHFDFDDIPRMPMLYLDYWRQTKQEHALRMARLGLEGILRYQDEKGLIPFDVYPWKNENRYQENWQRWSIPHSMRAMARGCGVWTRRDPAFARKVETSYQKFRSHVLRQQTNGLYMGTIWANGFVLDAIWHHYQGTRDAQDRKDLKTVADAICAATPANKERRQEFGENLPVIVFGLAKAYRELRDEKYLRTAESWLEYPILPSLKRDRRFWRSLPNFARSSSGPDGVPNALTVWYNAEALVEMYRATKEQKYLDLAAWELGDYFDPRYGPSMRMVDTGDAETEHWSSNHAEDAMRAFSKYIWSLQYPLLRANPSQRLPD